MRYDVVSIGGATIDTFLTSHSKDIHIKHENKQPFLCMPLGAKILVDTITTDVGGSAINTSLAFSRLGLRSAAIAKIGNDHSARTLLHKLHEEHVTFLGTSTSGQSGQSIILSGISHNRTILNCKGINNELALSDIAPFSTRWLYVGSLLGKGWNTECKIASRAKKHGSSICFNPSLYLAEQGVHALKPMLTNTDILILNKEEAIALVGNGTTISLLKKLHKHSPLCVITDGPRNVQAYDGLKTYSITPPAVHVIDPTGAGDAFAAGFLAGQILNKDIKSSLTLGCAQAANVLKHFGATNTLLNSKNIHT